MDNSSNEDSDFSVEGVDPNDGKWVIANRNKKNRKKNDRTPVQTMDKTKETEKDGDGVYVANPRDNITANVTHRCKGTRDKTCGLPILDGKAAIRCECCGDWFHLECQSLSLDAFEAVTKHNLLWLCNDCRPRIKEQMNIEEKIESKIASMEEKILSALKASKIQTNSEKGLESKFASIEKNVMDKIKDRESKVNAALQEQKEMVRAMPKYASEIQKSAQELQELVRKKDERGTRETNILIHNIPESLSVDPEVRKKYDSDSFDNIVHALLGEEKEIVTEKVYRLGKNPTTARRSGASHADDSKPRLLMVKLSKKEDVEELLRNRWSLSKVGFPNIYLTRDLMPEEREAQRRLREELRQKGKEHYRIFRGKIVPRE